MSKKVIVIGGGIAGLGAGIYAQKSGFDVTIFESHVIAGGNCTSWKRGGYLFEGGMHWLTGSAPKDPLHKIWRYTGALDDTVAIHTNDPFQVYAHGETEIKIYRDVDKTEKQLLDLSPADEKEIKRLCGYIRKIKNLTMPITDLRGVKVTKKSRPPLSLLFTLISALRLMGELSKITSDEYAEKFKHDGIREVIRSCVTDSSGVLPFVFTMGILARGDGGFPEGGSLPFAERMVKTYRDLGGELLLKTRADKVIVENGKAVGVMSGDKRFDADAVIVTADTMQLEHLFDFPLKSPWLDEMRETFQPMMCVLVSLGIDADLSKYPHVYYFKPNKPFNVGNETFEYLSFNNYAADPIYSPEGKSALTFILTGDTYDFWKKAKDVGNYKEEKQKVADEVIAALNRQIPETEGKVEVVDVATPLTYERYCGNWKGSWMTEMLPGMKMKAYPAVIKGLDGVYFAGHRLIPPGGLPPAVMSGRIAVQYLCRDTGTVFVSEK